MRDKPLTLIIDHNNEDRAILKNLLLELSYDTIEAAQTMQGIDLAHSHKPDLIFLEVQQNDLDSFQTASLLQSDPATYMLPIIFISELNNRFSILKAIQSGGSDYLYKPLKAETLQQSVQRIVTWHKLYHKSLQASQAHTKKLTAIHDILTQFKVLHTVKEMKQSLEKHSMHSLDNLHKVRTHIEEYEEDAALNAIAETEISLQFTDRVSQQLNEFAKIVTEIQILIDDKEALIQQNERDALRRSSTDSVLHDKQQNHENIDNLLKKLDL